jgi:hypothetical protein
MGLEAHVGIWVWKGGWPLITSQLRPMNAEEADGTVFAADMSGYTSSE